MSELGDLLRRFAGSPEGEAVHRALAAGGEFTAAKLWGAADAFLLAALSRRLPPALVVCADGDGADDLARDLRIFLGDEDAARVFPASDGEGGAPAADPAALAARLSLLQRLLDGRPPRFIVAPVAAALEPVVPPERLAASRRRIAVGDRLDLPVFAGELSVAGFTRVPMVEAPGEFSLRGGILDVFPRSREAPFRLEFFGDEVESIRQFEPANQRSVDKAESFLLSLLPVEELCRRDAPAAVTDYLPGGYLLVLSEETRIREWLAALDARTAGAGLVGRFSTLLRAPRAGATLRLTTRPVPPGAAGAPVVALALEGSARSLDELEGILEEVAAKSREVLLFASNDAEARRLSTFLAGSEFEGVSRVTVLVGRLSRSFRLPDLSAALLSHDEVFDRYRLRRPDRRRPSVPIADFVDLSPGDVVVHLAHGIGRYRGLDRIVKGGGTEEFLKVEFADSVMVYVPVTKAGLVQKYIGAKDAVPKLSRVGGSAWENEKARVKEAVRDLAADLLEIQAVRAAVPGIAFPPDDRMQTEFEASFQYEDTSDQTEANAAIKEDMQAPRPMDRLLCGDVGYGKTELAIRAAFKAVLAGKQVAVLVPTTVLAQQHLETFSQRLVDYPVVVEMLSRFRSPREQAEVVGKAARGAVDILIGTHRLLSADVRFADLGLVIVDEEQRFGVEHKSRLRQIRKTVDVLTMTATPIPRTLHMALLGIKDISTLATAPPGRQAIHTEVHEYDERAIRGWILREMNRGGQVFFVHNRVETIGRLAHRLGALVPEARIATVHGQMAERDLSTRMLAFIRGEVDVLLTTTIIESGLDIPNANTIIIDRADLLGLAELHQLRGRVGRYRHRAFCHLLLPPHRVPTVAERRIRAVEEFQELGAGFRIAMRDLEIRGAGNILGPQQSGHIAAVGYELYCELLEEAVKELKKLPVERRTDPFIELDVGARLPADYVPDERQRIEVYRKLSRSRSEDDLDAAVVEAEDRFGPLPEEAKPLVLLARLRILAAGLMIEHLVRVGRDRVVMRCADIPGLAERLSRIRNRLRIVDERTVHLLLADPRENGPELLADLDSAFRRAAPAARARR
ncbi:MAG: transcription-repair coupling factor [Planctomycetes bacterium]|nr:transcription-repair coupling factor [Planctomycetota bacterium]